MKKQQQNNFAIFATHAPTRKENKSVLAKRRQTKQYMIKT